VRCYPAAWRARYGEEFAQLLVDDMYERPRSLTRTVDVLRTGMQARLAGAGLSGQARDSLTRMRARLTPLWCALAASSVAALAMWSQLATGWRWSSPASPRRGPRCSS
jgi:hypothetical protein